MKAEEYFYGEPDDTEEWEYYIPEGEEWDQICDCGEPAYASCRRCGSPICQRCLELYGKECLTCYERGYD